MTGCGSRNDVPEVGFEFPKGTGEEVSDTIEQKPQIKLFTKTTT